MRQQATVTDIQMPFTSMVGLMVKWVIASIPALIILMASAGMVWSALLSFVPGLGR